MDLHSTVVCGSVSEAETVDQLGRTFFLFFPVSFYPNHWRRPLIGFLQVIPVVAGLTVQGGWGPLEPSNLSARVHRTRDEHTVHFVPRCLRGVRGAVIRILG